MLGRKPKDFRYVFPGQAKSQIRHNRIVLGWSIAAGLLVAGCLALALWAWSTGWMGL